MSALVSDTFYAFVRRRFVRWYMGRIAGRWCPCEWPIKSKRLMHLCGRIDDAAERESFRDFARFWVNHYSTANTSGSSANVTVDWKRPHGH